MFSSLVRLNFKKNFVRALFVYVISLRALLLLHINNIVPDDNMWRVCSVRMLLLYRAADR